MKFKMIDEYTVRCVLTEDDMIENNIKIEDFFHNREKVHNLLEVIIDKAKDEVGYQLNDNILSMQIMPLPKNSLAITISGKSDQDMNDIIDNVKNIAGMIGDDLEDSDEESDEDSDEDSDEESDEKSDDGNSDSLKNTKSLEASGLFDTQNLVKNVPRRNQKEVNKPVAKNGIKTFRFATLNEVEGFCKTMQRPKYVISHLFKDKNENCYYLVIEQGRLTVKTFNMVCGAAIEFADLLSHQLSCMAFISEHCDTLINKNAIATMRKIATVN